MGLSTAQWDSLAWLEAHAVVKLPGGNVHTDNGEIQQGSNGVDHEVDINVDTPAESAQRNSSLASSGGDPKDSDEGDTRGDQNLERVWLRMDKIEMQICHTIAEKRSLDLQVRRAKSRVLGRGE